MTEKDFRLENLCGPNFFPSASLSCLPHPTYQLCPCPLLLSLSLFSPSNTTLSHSPCVLVCQSSFFFCCFFFIFNLTLITFSTCPLQLDPKSEQIQCWLYIQRYIFNEVTQQNYNRQTKYCLIHFGSLPLSLSIPSGTFLLQKLSFIFVFNIISE